MNGVVAAVALVLLAVWLVRLIYAPVGSYTLFTMALIVLSLVYFSSETTYVPQAQLLYTTKA
jgi:hypothetical protein